MHSEDYANFAVADEARKLFWERIQKLAANLGVFRLWTQETSPFWKGWGFQPANPETLARLPEEWKNLEGQWLTLELKNEEAINRAMKIQFAGMMAEEQRQTARMVEHARFLRLLVIVGGFGIFFPLSRLRSLPGSARSRVPALDWQASVRWRQHVEFVRVIRAAHHGPAGDMHKTHRPRHAAQGVELFRAKQIRPRADVSRWAANTGPG